MAWRQAHCFYAGGVIVRSCAVGAIVAVNGSVMEFTSLCGASSVEGVGRYHWTLAGDNLHLDLIGKDECTGRSAILEDATSKRHG